MNFEFYKLVEDKLVQIKEEELSKLKDEDKVVVNLECYKFCELTEEIKKIIPGRILSCQHKNTENLTPTSFTIPFAINKCDLDVDLFTNKTYKTDNYIYYDLAYQVSKKRQIAITANKWGCEGTAEPFEECIADKNNFIRKWKEPVVLGADGLASYSQEDINIDMVMLTKGNTVAVMDKIKCYEPLFRNIVLVVDSETNSLKEEIVNYITKTYDEEGTDITGKIKVFERPLNKDFAAQRNFGTSKCTSEWVFHLDDDEHLSEVLQKTLLRTASMANTQRKVGVIFPRKNILNGVLVNDIPRSKWNEVELKELKESGDAPLTIIKEFDFQARLHKRFVLWVRKVHEMITPLYQGLKGVSREANKLLIAQESYILHDKTVVKQDEQNARYDDILVGNKNIFFDSIMYTQEGITKHAREEAKQLLNNGWNIFLTDTYRRAHDKVFKQMYNAFDVEYDNYVTYVNQPPLRADNQGMCLASRLHMPNIVYYLAFEGNELPTAWIPVMDNPSIKKILTPSNYCKEVFEKSLKRNSSKIEVLPHGIDTNLFHLPEGNRKRTIVKDDNKKAFLYVGTWKGGKKDRKGLDLLMNSWNEVNKQLPDWKLVLKLNSIYFDSQHWSHTIRNFIGGTKNIEIIDTDLTDEQMAELYRDCEVFVLATRSEGFGIPALEAKACGLPLIITGKTGHMDFVNTKSDMLIKVLRETPAEKNIPYFGRMQDGTEWHVKWVEPSGKHLTKLMLNIDKTYPKKDLLIKEANKVAKEYNWKVIGDKFNKICENVLKGGN